MVGARADTRDGAKARHARTRQLIELSGLVQKSGLPELVAAIEPDVRDVLLGALLDLADELQASGAGSVFTTARVIRCANAAGPPSGLSQPAGYRARRHPITTLRNEAPCAVSSREKPSQTGGRRPAKLVRIAQPGGGRFAIHHANCKLLHRAEPVRLDVRQRRPLSP